MFTLRTSPFLMLSSFLRLCSFLESRGQLIMSEFIYKWDLFLLNNTCILEILSSAPKDQNHLDSVQETKIFSKTPGAYYGDQQRSLLAKGIQFCTNFWLFPWKKSVGDRVPIPFLNYQTKVTWHIVLCLQACSGHVLSSGFIYVEQVFLAVIYPGWYFCMIMLTVVWNTIT